jgi:hypothetical protein
MNRNERFSLIFLLLYVSVEVDRHSAALETHQEWQLFMTISDFSPGVTRRWKNFSDVAWTWR